MKSSTITSSNREALIQRWQRQLHGRTHITFQELMYLLRQRVRKINSIIFDLFLFFEFLSAIIRNTFLFIRSRFQWFTFGIRMDWIDLQSDRVFFIYSTSEYSLEKSSVFRISNRTKDVRSLESFLNNFKHLSVLEHDSLTVQTFCKLFEDSSVEQIEDLFHRNLEIF